VSVLTEASVPELGGVAVGSVGWLGVENPWIEYSTPMCGAAVICMAQKKNQPKLTALKVNSRTIGTINAVSMRLCPDSHEPSLALHQGTAFKIAPFNRFNLN